MKDTENGKITSSKGEFYFENFLLAPESSFSTVNKERVFIIMEVPDTLINEEDKVLIQGLLIGTIFIVPLLLLLAWRLSDYQVEQARLLEKLSFDASHDALTGLFNRKAIVDYLKKQLAQSRRSNLNIAVAFIDVNDLKYTNDQLGHDAGDELIKGVSAVINKTVRDSDFAARFGGDEFLIVLSDCTAENANILLQRIQSRYSSLGVIKAGKKWSLSFGCTEFLGSEDSAENMIERADNAMYKHKAYQKLAEKSGDVI